MNYSKFKFVNIFISINSNHDKNEYDTHDNMSAVGLVMTWSQFAEMH